MCILLVLGWTPFGSVLVRGGICSLTSRGADTTINECCAHMCVWLGLGLACSAGIKTTLFWSYIVQIWQACVNYSLRFLFLAYRSITLCDLLLLYSIYFEV